MASEAKHQDQHVSCSCTDHTLVRLRVVGPLLSPPRLLEHFQQRCLHTILNIHLSEFITNIEILKRAEVTSIEALLLKSQLCWAEHVSRMEDHHLPKIVLYRELSTDHRDRGAPKKRYKDNLNKSLGARHVDHRQWSNLTATPRGALSTKPLAPLELLAEQVTRTMPIPHRTRQSSASLQLTWTTPSMIFVCEAKS